MIEQGALPAQVVEMWPEIFEGVTMYQLPLQYVEFINITFLDGTNTELVINANQQISWEMLDKAISQCLEKYDDEILDIDFQLNITQLKSDVIKATRRFLRKRKL
jgi:hypothetical protein